VANPTQFSFDSTGDRVAFEDEYVMVYPVAAPWPAGEVDLLGPGY
jgi:hypothetical protein